ncbi:methyltransferase domain-containing protein [uncultured Thalassospira sp.]|uniref:methyltransferase domain-containing protein n=1 Tax=uncultured Thalassospira sp. TaxID=404382 RepID=UPI002590A744|nr:methyltransferase domain-containing protein [uncultured Thalassospira sp.]
MSNDPRELLSSALSLWWLRPENGLAIASYTHNGYDFFPKEGQVAADYACGDGINTFFKAGGRFDKNFDIFGAAVRSASADQIVGEKIDVFDHFDESYQPAVVKRPDVKFAYGTDHKAKLLQKADRLGYYDNLIEADLANDVEIADESLDIVYCNSLYWTPVPEQALGHMYKKLKPGGLAVFDVMTTHRKALRYQHLMPTMSTAWQNLMNRGRDQNNPGIRSDREWRKLFEANGAAKLEDVRNIFPSAIAHVWNIGLRPIFPVLNRMVQAIPDASDVQGIKEEWVETWTDLMLPLLLEPQEFPNTGTQVRLQYVARKK